MAYCDYTFYTTKYCGKQISQEDFSRFATRASDFIYIYTKGAADNATGKAKEMVGKATCALAEVLQDETNMTSSAYSGESKLSSESVGSWSKSYTTPSLSSTEIDYLDKRKKDVLALYLENLPEFSGLFRAKSYRCVHEARGYRR